ncbi:MAG: signal peptidase II [Pseudomonadota bacterium]|nr:lipoprotein signal peptidase [Gammaproteobacteria bacterium]
MNRPFFYGKNYIWLLVSLLVITLDRFTKYLAVEHLLSFHSRPVMPFVDLTLMYNMGAAFSFLNAPVLWHRFFFLAIEGFASLGIFIWIGRIASRNYWLLVGLSLVLGGALGNCWDRITLGYVVDFIDLYIKHWHWPVFNLADAAITTGMICIVIHLLRDQKQ